MEGIGKANEVVMVNSGYFNNFLRPKALATIISDEQVGPGAAPQPRRGPRAAR